MSRADLATGLAHRVIRPRHNHWALRRVLSDVAGLVADLGDSARRRGAAHDVVFAHRAADSAHRHLRAMGTGDHVSLAPLTARHHRAIEVVFGEQGMQVAADPDTQHAWINNSAALFGTVLAEGWTPFLEAVARRSHATADASAAGVSSDARHDPVALFRTTAWAAAAGASVAGHLQSTAARPRPASPLLGVRQALVGRRPAR